MVRQTRIVAIVRKIPPAAVVSVAKALYAGGIRLMEITCNTPDAARMIEEVCRAVGDRMLIGAGTVITPDLAEEVRLAGARYMVAPDVNPEVIEYCTQRDIPIIPGAATATEVLGACRLGARMVKVFPADGLGVDYIRQLRGPLDDVDLVAVGGVTVENAVDFLRAGCVAVGLGGSLVGSEIVAKRDWPELTRLAQSAREACAAP